MEARLLQVIKIPTSQISKHFIEFDTKYLDNGHFLYYELPKCKDMIILIFKNHVNKLFPTLRRYTPEKYKWYKSNEGNMFEVIINGQEGNNIQD